MRLKGVSQRVGRTTKRAMSKHGVDALDVFAGFAVALGVRGQVLHKSAEPMGGETKRLTRVAKAALQRPATSLGLA